MRERQMTRQAVKGLGTILVLGAFLAGVLIPGSFATAAEKYPTKPVVLLVPFAAGGGTDLAARIYANNISKYLGQSMVVENRSNTPQGMIEVGQTRPDGYTLGFFGITGFNLYKYLLPVYPDPANFEPVAQLVGYTRCLAVSEGSGFKSLQELVAWAKKNPKKLLVGINPGVASHLETVTIMKAAGIEPNYIPFKSGGERVVALAGGHLQVSVDAVNVFQPYVDAKKVRILGIASKERVSDYKEIPTLIEQGINVVCLSRQGIFVPKKVPPEIIQIIETAFQKTAKDETCIEQFRKMKEMPDFEGRQEFVKIFAEESARINSLAKELGMIKEKK